MFSSIMTLHGHAAMGRSKPTVEKGTSQNNSLTVQNTYNVKRPSGLERVMIGIGEQVYSILLLSVFFLEVYATRFILYIGKVLNFLLLSWMYKWNFNEVALARRLDYFESYWPFFAGFGIRVSSVGTPPSLPVDRSPETIARSSRKNLR